MIIHLHGCIFSFMQLACRIIIIPCEILEKSIGAVFHSIGEKIIHRFIDRQTGGFRGSFRDSWGLLRSFFSFGICTTTDSTFSDNILPTLDRFVEYALLFLHSSSTEMSLKRPSLDDIEIYLRLCAVLKYRLQCSS